MAQIPSADATGKPTAVQNATGGLKKIMSEMSTKRRPTAPFLSSMPRRRLTQNDTSLIRVICKVSGAIF